MEFYWLKRGLWLAFKSKSKIALQCTSFAFREVDTMDFMDIVDIYGQTAIDEHHGQ